MTEKIDLAAEGLIGGPSPAGQDPADPNAQTPGEDDFIEYINGILLGLQDSMGSLQIGLRIMNQRIGSLEKYVGYLLEQDPEMGKKVKAHLAKIEAAEAAAAAKNAEAPTEGQAF